MKIHPSAFLVICALCIPCVQASELKASRLIEADQLDQQLEQLSSRLSINERELDPFGQYQEPREKRLVRPPAPPVGGGQIRVQQAPFARLVDRFPVAAVIPKDGRVLMGGKFYEVGQAFPVRLNGREFQVEVAKVAPAQVDFRNVKTGEIGTYKFKQVPMPVNKEKLRKDFAPELPLDLN